MIQLGPAEVGQAEQISGLLHQLGYAVDRTTVESRLERQRAESADADSVPYSRRR